MRQLSSIIVGLLAVMVVFAPGTASADLGDVLGDIEWGDDRDEVVEKLRADKLDELREDPQLQRDRSAMQEARQRTLDRVRQIEDTYTELEGEETGFEVSVISTEFTSDNDESMLRVRDDFAQRFYFFLDDEFYKLVVAYDESHIGGVGFGAFVDQAGDEYGSPAATDHADGEAVWESGDYKLTIRDQRDFFDTYTMTFADRERIQRLENQGEVFGGRDADDGDEGVSQRVEDVTGFGEGTSDGSVVDDITGESVDDVEFTDEDEVEEEEHDEEATARAAADESADEEEDDEPAASASQQEDTGTAGGSDEDDDDDSDLVIY